MTTPEKLRDAVQKGAISRSTALLFVCELITEDNVEDILSRLPDDFIAELRQWNLAAPVPFFASNLTLAKKQEIEEHQMQVAFPAIRAWLARRSTDEARLNGTPGTTPVAQEVVKT